MQLKTFEIRGLFGSMDHVIHFPVPKATSTQPALVILHGRNGVGKTTILRMLDGMMRLDFNSFRAVPFRSCSLTFDSGASLSVTPRYRTPRALAHLNVTFQKLKARLHARHPGPCSRADSADVSEFRRAFMSATADVRLEFIHTQRFAAPESAEDSRVEVLRRLGPSAGHIIVQAPHDNPKARHYRHPATMAGRVLQFIRDAQVNYRTFFSSTEPDLFPRIIDRLTTAKGPSYRAANLKARLKAIHDQDLKTRRFGLESDRWDYTQLLGRLNAMQRRSAAARNQALTVLGSYVEVLESRAAERALVAERLLSFETLVSGFFTDKTFAVDQREGFLIRTSRGRTLRESQLSSGEYHLLFLLVAALVTRRRGTIIAIDEPELSMHIAWQRKLVPALLQCASGAEPLFILATHSPDVVAAYPDALVELK